MTAETDLPPLPEPGMLHVGEPREWFTADQMRDYARANISIATAAKDAETEALRAEVELLRRGIVPRDDDMIMPAKLLDEINASGAEWQARAERLAEALRRYGVHDQACVAANIPICTCGLDAALEQEAGRG